MFAGFVFVASADVPASTRAAVRRFGGAVVDEFLPSATHGLVAAPPGSAPPGTAPPATAPPGPGTAPPGTASATAASVGRGLACARRLRRLRLPIVRDDWVRASAAAGRALPTRYPLAAHDPDLFAELHFTTTRVPQAICKNVIAAVLFFGGSYAAEMTAATNVVLHGLRGSDCNSAVESPKARAAAARGIPCVSIAWVQDCISAGRRLPFYSTAAEDREKGAANSSASQSPSAAARKRRGQLDSVVERIVARRVDGAEGNQYHRLISQIEEELLWD